MHKLLTLLQLMINFTKGAFLSGLDTAGFILRQPHTSGGLTHMDYQPLTPLGASVLAAMVTLTPGTTVVHIDLEKHQFILHLLDIEQREAVLNSIQREFVMPLAVLTGANA